jgi:hypothetical protein
MHSGPTPRHRGSRGLRRECIPMHSGPTPMHSGPTPRHRGSRGLRPECIPMHSGPTPMHSGPTPRHRGSRGLRPECIPMHSGPTPMHRGPRGLRPGPIPRRPECIPRRPECIPRHRAISRITSGMHPEASIHLLDYIHVPTPGGLPMPRFPRSMRSKALNIHGFMPSSPHCHPLTGPTDPDDRHHRSPPSLAITVHAWRSARLRRRVHRGHGYNPDRG